jgi:hypothetical protein
MNTAQHIHKHIIPAAFALLPPRMTSEAAAAQLLAIGFIESDFRYRQQVRGPARGFWQFEQGGGVRGVLEHPQTRSYIREVLATLSYPPLIWDCHVAIEHNDVLAAAFARLLLWSSPMSLPGRDDPAAGWKLYLSTWRPGKPRPDAWGAHFARAWRIVDGDE